MSLIDGLLLTLLNTVACLMLPKMLSVILGNKTKSESQSVIELPASSSEMPNLIDAV
ncbi:hypothetical protein H6G76_08515 [Nostoc sp. FACHB-152]|uniref:hypothetical protein n=1 Tax=unclassified Nostoc TaxID=2593658 RepID=UPI001684D32A|nr:MULTISPECIES: hypothetical protein [unclassified Nostoc]MBD2447207.1 hypothetical protein [Nostoc sp. FACHB-152]MBD2468192.1 hypothetical protein [Nostoc sp. FACHB-145]